ncbi:MAG: hypothetical protein JWQ71_1291 [Pedosphaera sp.]|nr:hypothetical protein [Pedosphaera sp.]
MEFHASNLYRHFTDLIYSDSALRSLRLNDLWN